MRIPRILAAGLAAVAATALAAPAGAHVTIPEPATAGGFGVITLTVPNERDDAATVGLEVQLPRDEVLASVRPQPKPGWAVEVTTRTLDEPVELFGSEVTEVVDTVTWSGGRIEPGQFDTFQLQAGRLPEGVDTLAFPAIQIYDSGEEVAWIELAGDDGEEPDHPAPLLRLLPGDGATAGGGHGDTGGDADGTDHPADDPTDDDAGDPAADDADADADAGEDEDAAAAPADTAAPAAGDDDGGTDGVAVAALVVAIVAALLGGAALVTGRRRTA